METRDHDGIPYGCAEEPEGWGESGEYVADGLRTLRGDIVWRAPWRDAPGYLYFLVEIRSRPDPEMPNRMKRYAIHLPQAADPGEIPPGALPPTYPIVLHTDTGKWRWDPDPDVGWRPEGCPGEAAALLAPYQVRQLVRFLSLADMDDADLARMDGIAPRVLRLARARTLRDLEAGLMPLLEMLAAPEFAALREPVLEWLRHVLLPTLNLRKDRLNGTFEEVFAMAQVISDEWKEEYREEGRIEGEERRALKDALNFLKENISVETVSRCTDPPLEKVRELAATLKRD